MLHETHSQLSPAESTKAPFPHEAIGVAAHLRDRLLGETVATTGSPGLPVRAAGGFVGEQSLLANKRHSSRVNDTDLQHF
jgi:hypothetical protein